MQDVSYEEAMENFSDLLDNVSTRHEVVTVRDASQRAVVMISKDDYDSISGLTLSPRQNPGNNNLDGWL